MSNIEDHLKTIREARDLLVRGDLLCEIQASTLLDQAIARIEKMVSEQKPVGEVYRHGKDSHGRPWHGIHWYDANVNVPSGTKLYTAAQVAQQPQAPEGYALIGIDALKAWGVYDQVREACQYPAAPQQVEAVPVDMVLYCPKCGVQHIDAPDWFPEASKTEFAPVKWTNPPHKSHLCHGCSHIWRPSDTPTNGVKATASGKDADTAPQQAEAVPSDVVRYRWLLRHYLSFDVRTQARQHGSLDAAIDAALAQQKGGV